MDKDARIARLQARLVAINYERAAIDAEIAALTSQEQMEAVDTVIAVKGIVRST